MMRNAICLAAVIFAGSASAQDAEIQIDGMVEQFFTSGGFADTHKTRDRFTRYTGIVTSGKWSFRLSEWYYPFCGWEELDETHISFEDDDITWRLGRFILPVGQANWDDQWYSGFVFVPLVEFNAYDGRMLFERTSAGTDVDIRMGSSRVKASLTGRDQSLDRPLPDQFDRASLRYTWHEDGLILGVSGAADTDDWGKREQFLSTDFRYTMPQWTFRGSFVAYQSQTQKSNGFYLDAYYRPEGWTDFTFVSRLESLEDTVGGASNRQDQWILGGKARLPWDMTFVANYAGGPDMNNVVLGGGWSFSLSKTFRF